MPPLKSNGDHESALACLPFTAIRRMQKNFPEESNFIKQIYLGLTSFKNRQALYKVKRNRPESSEKGSRVL